MRQMLKTGDPCPCCGQPIKTTDLVTLRLLGVVADMIHPKDPVPQANGLSRALQDEEVLIYGNE